MDAVPTDTPDTLANELVVPRIAPPPVTLQFPPGEVLKIVAVEPMQMDAGPEVAEGVAYTVTGATT
jgi:hypothetical protein